LERQVDLAMTFSSDTVEFGGHSPGAWDRGVIALTSRMPDNWIGLRLAIFLRPISTIWLKHPGGALDVVRWGMRLRLHPWDNGCEKNLLFTPQMYEVSELAVLSEEIAVAEAQGRRFTFIDIGANVGLFSFFVAASAKPDARILAIEPEAENFARLLFNIRSNPGVPIRAMQLALGDEEGELMVERAGGDRGGTRTRKVLDAAFGTVNQRVEGRTLHRLVQDEGIDNIDAIKIDVEGTEDLILIPFFRDAPPSLWPRLLLIEDGRDLWTTDLFSFLAAKGYAIAARSKLNLMLRRQNA
jgi:FkbM family methyltransferase